jgi:hypothetical protein
VERRGRGVERIGREEGGERVVGKKGGGSGAARRGRGRAGGVRRGRAGSRRGRAGRGVSDLRPDRGRRRCGRRCGRKRRSRWSPRGGGLGPLGRGIVEEAKRRQGIERADAVYEAVERTQRLTVLFASGLYPSFLRRSIAVSPDIDADPLIQIRIHTIGVLGTRCKEFLVFCIRCKRAAFAHMYRDPVHSESRNTVEQGLHFFPPYAVQCMPEITYHSYRVSFVFADNILLN